MPLRIPKYILSPSDSYSLTYVNSHYSDGPVYYSSRFLRNGDKAQMNELASLQQQEVRSCLDSFHRITDSYCHRLETWVRTNPAEYERFLIRLASRFNLSVDDERIYSLAAESISRLPSIYSGSTPRVSGTNCSSSRPMSGRALRRSHHDTNPVQVNSPQSSRESLDPRPRSLATCMEQKHYINKDWPKCSVPEGVVSLRVHVRAPDARGLKRRESK